MDWTKVGFRNARGKIEAAGSRAGACRAAYSQIGVMR
jgi:hypothetical protein